MAEEEKRGEKWLKTDETDMAWKNKGIYIRFALIYICFAKMNILYQISSKMLHSTKVIILVEKKIEKGGGLAGIPTHDLFISPKC